MRDPVSLSRGARALAVLWLAVAALGLLWLTSADRTPLREARKRQLQQKELRVEHWMAIGFRQAAWTSLVTGLAAVATVRWWGASRSGRSGVLCPAAAGGKWFWLGMAAALAFAAFYRLPRLDHSFWTDEAFVVRAYVWGVKQPQPDGSLAFKPVDWKTALFWNKGNNHVWCSFEARLALKAWQRMSGQGAEVFNETAMRLPAFMWSLGTVVALGLLGRMVGGWMIGVLCAFLLALHPWHLRFCEVRGYAAMLLALTLGVICWLRALDDGRWRWWLGTAAMNLWALLAFAGCVYFPLMACGLAAVRLYRRRDWTSLGRMIIANALAAVAFLWCFGPSLPQLAAYVRSGVETGSYQMTWGWYQDLGAALAAGIPWSSSFVNIESHPSRVLVAALFLLAVAAGFAWMIRSAGPARLVAAVFLAGTFLCLAQNAATRAPMVVWYLLPALPGALMAFAFVCGKLAVRSHGRRLLSALVAAAVLVFWVVATTPVRDVIVHTDRQPMRQAAEHASTAVPAAITGIVGVSDRQMLLYDPRVAVLKSSEDFAALETKAAALNRPLVIYVGGPIESRRRAPELVDRLLEPDFTPLAAFTGLEEMFSYVLYEKR